MDTSAAAGVRAFARRDPRRSEQIARKLTRAWHDGTLAAKVRHHAADVLYVPAASVMRSRRLPRSDRTLDLHTGFHDHRGSSYELRCSDAALRRLVVAFAKAEADRPEHCPPELEVRGLWSEWLDLHYRPLRQALREEDVPALRVLLENLHRDSLSTGVGGTIDDVNRVPRPFLRSYYTSLWCRYRDLLRDVRPQWEDVSSPIVGNPVGVWIRNDLVQIETLRHAHHATVILGLLQGQSNARIVEIGGGLGGQAYQCVTLGARHLARHTIIDLPEVACLSAYCLLAALGEDRVRLFGEESPTGPKPHVDVLPHWSISALGDLSTELVYNSHSFSEMDSNSATFYLREVERIATRFFFHINHETRYRYRVAGGGYSLNRIGSEMAPQPQSFDLIGRHSQAFIRPENRANKGFAYLYRRRDGPSIGDDVLRHWVHKNVQKNHTAEHQRVLFLSSSSELYGSDRAMIELASALAALGHTVAVAVPYDGPLLYALSDRGIQFFVVPLFVVDRSLAIAQLFSLAAAASRARAELVEAFRAFHPDFIYSNTSHVIDGPALSRAFRVPHIWHLREIERVHSRIRYLYGYWLLANSARVIAISDAVRRSYYRPRQPRVVTVPDGIDIEYYCSQHSDVALQAYSTDRPLRLLSIGRITPWKGQDVAVNAVILLVDQGYPVELRVVGGALTEPDRVFERRLHDLSVPCPAISFGGEVTDVRPFYRWCDVFMHNAVQPEPFGRVIVEAMAGRCAVVASDLGGPREIIRNDVDGRLIQPGDPQVLAATLQELVTFPCRVERMASAAYARSKDFSIDATSRAVADVLTAVSRQESVRQRFRADPSPKSRG